MFRFYHSMFSFQVSNKSTMANLMLPFLLLAIATAYFAAGVELVENDGHQGVKRGNTMSASEHVPAADRTENDAYALAAEEPGPSAECEGEEIPTVPSIEGAIWVAAANGTLPEGALKGGIDGNMDLYVARAKHKGAIIPGKLCTQHRFCYIAWGSKELAEASYEVLVIPNDQASWVATPGKTIPPNAIPGGLSCECETLFVCRAPHAGTLSIGKVYPSHAVCYIPYEYGVHSYSQYEVLVKND